MGTASFSVHINGLNYPILLVHTLNTPRYMSTDRITLKKRLKSFLNADTSSESKGFVDAGSFKLKEFKKDFPNADTDYALIESPELGEVWVCARWKDTSYTEVSSAASEEGSITSTVNNNDVLGALSRVNFDSDIDAIEESELTSLVQAFDGFTYDLHNPTYPFNLKGINVPQTPPLQNNCCTFVEGLTVKAWMDSFPDFEWNNKRHGQMMIYSADDYFSPVTAAIESGMGKSVTDVEAAPDPWTLVQGWKTQWTGGHTFIIVDHHKESDKVLTLESNKAFGLNGVGFRKIGMAAAFNHRPPENWWELPGVWTWEQIKNSYKFRAMATLKVKNRSWAWLS